MNAPLDAGAGRRGRRHRDRASAQPLLLPVATIVYAAAVSLLVFLQAPPSYRAAPVLLFVVLVPGIAVVRLLRIPGVLVQLTLGLAVSLALAVLVPSLMVYAGWWSPRGALVVLVAIAALASAAALVRELRRLRSEVARRPPS